VEGAVFVYDEAPAAVVISGMGINGDFNQGNSEYTVCHKKSQVFTFRSRLSMNMIGKTPDAYILRFGFNPPSYEPTGIRPLGTCRYDASDVTCAILKNL
jgi:hypothetical protein